MKSVVHNAIDACLGWKDRGIVRHDSLIPPLSSLQQVEPTFIATPFLTHQRLPDPLHLLENISNDLYHCLEHLLDKKTMTHAQELIRTHTGITKLTGLVPSHRWRTIWGSYPLTWAVALAAPKYAWHRTTIAHLSMVSSILYAKPEYRDGMSWLRLIGASFALHRSFVELGIKIRLNQHLLWPHFPDVYQLIDGYNISCEAHEYQWKIVRKLWPSINRTAPDAVTQLMTRLCSQNYARYLHVNRHDRQRHSKLRRWWTGIPVIRFTFTGDRSALIAMLTDYRFKEGQWWHRDKDSVILHTASTDTTHPTPRPMSLTHTAALMAEVHTEYVYNTVSIANARDPNRRAAAPGAAAVKPEPLPPPDSEDEDMWMADVDDLCSSDEDYDPRR